jgi:hypothetical protein
MSGNNEKDHKRPPDDGSGSGADSALQAMIRKRPPRPAQGEAPHQQTQQQGQPQKKPKDAP